MSEQACNCGRPTTGYVCEECLTDLSRALGEVPALVDELEVTITKAKGVDYSAASGATVSKTQPLPYHMAASDARARLRQAMFTWIKFCSEEHVKSRGQSDAWPADTLTAMSRWLMWRVDGLGLSDLGCDAVEEITSAVASCRRVIDRPAERRYAGPCECGRDLYHKPGATQVTCRECERTYDVGELYQWMTEQVRGRLVTAHEGSLLLCQFGFETPKRIIYGWEERARIIGRGANPAGKRLYLFDDLLDLAAKRSA